MKRFFLLLAILGLVLTVGCAGRMAVIERAGATDIDTDSNAAVDVPFGGTNANSAAAALTNLGAMPAAGGTATGEHDYSGASLELPNSATLPATCTAGQIYVDTDATTGEQVYVCEAGSWVLQGGAGGGAIVDLDALPGDDTDNDKVDHDIVEQDVEACLAAAPATPFEGQLVCADGDNWQIEAAQGTDDWLVRYRSSDTSWRGVYDITTGERLASSIDATLLIDVPLTVLSDTIIDPVDADDHLWKRLEYAVTASQVYCIAEGGGTITITIQECDGTGASCVAKMTALTCDSDGATAVPTDTTWDFDNWLKVLYGAPSGTVDSLSFGVRGVEAW